MKMFKFLSKTHTDLADDEITQVEAGLTRLQSLADHHRRMADKYQAGVDAIRGLKDEDEVLVVGQPIQPAPVATPLMRRTRAG